MSPIEIKLLIIGISLLVILILHLGATLFASYWVYTATLRRRKKSQWSREAPADSELQNQMFIEGEIWHQQVLEYKKDVHIVNKDFNLYGEYYDRGAKKTVIILSGRTDTVKYGYYFAQPYWASGFNVLTIDSRAHGYSDGVFVTAGFEEGKDALAWIKYLYEKEGVESVVLHGLCIGSAAGVYASIDPECPPCVKGMISDGMFINFYESMRNNLLFRNKLVFPIMQFIEGWFKKNTGHTMKVGPIDCIHKMKTPILMLQSKEDKSSLPHNAVRLYEACGSEKKELVMFEKGAHSMLRITDTEKYDKVVRDFLATLDC